MPLSVLLYFLRNISVSKLRISHCIHKCKVAEVCDIAL